jgi:serine protease inhibitor
MLNLQIGLKHLFTKSADLSGITAKGEEPTYISDVVQKAFIEVNEEGTTAAAVTSGTNLFSFSNNQNYCIGFIF